MAIINGTSGNDIITGTNSNDTINGGEGNDIISGGKGNDIIISGSGNNLLYGDFNSYITPPTATKAALTFVNNASSINTYFDFTYHANSLTAGNGVNTLYGNLGGFALDVVGVPLTATLNPAAQDFKLTSNINNNNQFWCK